MLGPSPLRTSTQKSFSNVLNMKFNRIVCGKEQQKQIDVNSRKMKWKEIKKSERF